MSKHLAAKRRRLFEEGQALVEYALIIAFVAIVCAALLGALGTGVSSIIQQVADAF